MMRWLVSYLEGQPIWWHFWDPRTGVAGGIVTSVLAGLAAWAMGLI